MTVCAKGLHKVTKDSHYTDTIRSRGKIYKVQRCRTCRRDSTNKCQRKNRGTQVENCRDCGREVAITRRKKLLVKHKAPAGFWCQGSGTTP